MKTSQVEKNICSVLILSIFTLLAEQLGAQVPTSLPSPQHVERMRAISSVDVVIERLNQKITLESNGETKIQSTVAYRAQSEKGRVAIGIREIPFNAAAGTIKVISAATINGETRTPVLPKNILVKSFSDSAVGLENIKKVIVPFNNVLANSIVEIQYEQSVKPNIPGIAELSLHFDPATPILNFEATASSSGGFNTSAIGFAKSPNSPLSLQNVFNLQRTGPPVPFTMLAKSAAPIFTAFELQGKALLEPGDIPVIYFSNAKTWSAIATKLAEKYDAISNSQLPIEFQKIRDVATNEKSDRLKLDRIHFELSKLISYSGNWTTLESAYFPKGHGTVASERKGDCKDFATSIVAIAKSIGFEANVALVHSADPTDRTLRDQLPNLFIPTSDYFNHAIAKVKAKDGRIYWIDGTRATPSSEVPWPEIIDSPALVIAKDTAGIEKVQAGSAPDNNHFKIQNTLQVNGSAFPTWTGKLETGGGFSPHIFDQLKGMGSENIEKYLSLLLIGPSAKPEIPVKSAMSLFNEEFRDFQKLQFPYEAVGQSPVRVDGTKKDLRISSAGVNLFARLFNAEKGSSIYIGASGKYEFETRYEGVRATDVVRGDCMIKSEWIDFDRKVTTDNTGTTVSEKIEIKNERIQKHHTFQVLHDALLSDISTCLRTDHLTLTPPEVGQAHASLSPEVKKFLLVQPNASEKQAAKEVLEHSLELENEYINMKAKRIFEEAIRENPKDIEAHLLKFRTIRNLAMVTSANYKTGLIGMIETEAAKLLEAFPSDAQIFVSRGLTRSLVNRNAEALADLKKAYALSPNDFLVRRTMAVVLHELNHNDTAEQWLKSAFSLITVKDSPVESRRNEIFYWQTMIDIKRNHPDPTASLEAHENYVRLRSDSPWALHNYAMALAHAKQLDKSIEHSRRALKMMTFGNGQKVLAGNLIAKALSFQKSPTDETYVLKPEVEKLMLEAKQVSPTDAYVNKALAIFYRDKALATKESDWLDPADLYIAEGLKYNPDDSGLLAVDRDLDEYKRRLMEYFDQRKINPSGRWPASWKIKYGHKAGPQ